MGIDIGAHRLGDGVQSLERHGVPIMEHSRWQRFFDPTVFGLFAQRWIELHRPCARPILWPGASRLPLFDVVRSGHDRGMTEGHLVVNRQRTAVHVVHRTRFRTRDTGLLHVHYP